MTCFTTRFDAYATAMEVADGCDLSGERVVVTGGNSGLEQGAASTVLAATSPELAARGGLYLDSCREGEVVHQANADRNGVAAYAMDSANAERLWEHSLRLVCGAL
jgi:hypothetical protein